MIVPQELQKNPPRDIKYTDELFAKNRKKSKGIMIGSLVIIPLVGLLFWVRFNDLLTGILFGAGIAALGALMGYALMINAKKAVNLCQNGVLVTGNVQKANITGNTGKYTGPDSAGYIFITVQYKDASGRDLKGAVSFIGNKKEIDLKDGDQVPVLYLSEKPDMFILYSSTLGISTFGKGKYT